MSSQGSPNGQPEQVQSPGLFSASNIFILCYPASSFPREKEPPREPFSSRKWPVLSEGPGFAPVPTSQFSALLRVCCHPTSGTHNCASFLAILTLVWKNPFKKLSQFSKLNIKVLQCNLSRWNGWSENDGKYHELARMWSHRSSHTPLGEFKLVQMLWKTVSQYLLDLDIRLPMMQ